MGGTLQSTIYMGAAKPGSGGGQVSSVNSKTGDVVLTAKDVNAIPQYTTMPTATSSNVGEIAQYSGTTDATYTNGYFYKSTREQAVGTATISQTTGSSLSNLAVDVATFETQENTTGNYEFEAVEEQAEINFTDENGWEVELDANGIPNKLGTHSKQPLKTVKP